MIAALGGTFVPSHGGSGIRLYAAPEIVEHTESVCGFWNALPGGPLEPGGRALIVAGHAITRRELSTELELRAGQALLGRLPVPGSGLLGIPGHATAFGIHDADIVLRLSKTLLGSLAQPAHGFDIVPAAVVRVCVVHAESKLGARIAALGTPQQHRHIAGIPQRIGGRCVDGNHSCAQYQHGSGGEPGEGSGENR